MAVEEEIILHGCNASCTVSDTEKLLNKSQVFTETYQGFSTFSLSIREIVIVGHLKNFYTNTRPWDIILYLNMLNK